MDTSFLMTVAYHVLLQTVLLVFNYQIRLKDALDVLPRLFYSDHNVLILNNVLKEPIIQG